MRSGSVIKSISVTTEDVLNAIAEYDTKKGDWRKWGAWTRLPVQADQADMAKLKAAFRSDLAGQEPRSLTRGETFELVKILCSRICEQNSVSDEVLQRLEDKFSSFVKLARVFSDYNLLEVVFDDIYVRADHVHEINILIDYLKLKGVSVARHAALICRQEDYSCFGYLFQLMLDEMLTAGINVDENMGMILRVAKYAEFVTDWLRFARMQQLPLASYFELIADKAEMLTSISDVLKKKSNHFMMERKVQDLLHYPVDMLKQIYSLTKFIAAKYDVTSDRFNLICQHAGNARVIKSVITIMEAVLDAGIAERLDSILQDPLSAVIINPDLDLVCVAKRRSDSTVTRLSDSPAALFGQAPSVGSAPAELSRGDFSFQLEALGSATSL